MRFVLDICALWNEHRGARQRTAGSIERHYKGRQPDDAA
jgi:hypothetical protein